MALWQGKTFHVTGPLWGNPPISTVEFPVIWDAMKLLWCHCFPCLCHFFLSLLLFFLFYINNKPQFQSVSGELMSSSICGVCMECFIRFTRLTHWPLGDLNENYFQTDFNDLWLRYLCEMIPRRMWLDLTDDKSTLVQVMAWCRQATSHYLSQCWPSSISPYSVIRPQWVNTVRCHYHALSYL